MKVCIFSGFYPLKKGGAEYQTRILGAELTKKYKFEIFYISLGHDKDEILEIDGLKVYTIAYNNKHNKLLWYYPVMSKVSKIITKESPDVIYQRILNSFSFHLAQYSEKRNVPFFIHVADEYSLKFGLSLSSIIRKFFFKQIIKTKAQFIVQTSNQETLLSYYGVKPVLKIYNIHPEPPQTEIINLEDKGHHLILWAGSARIIKQLELFIKLADLCRNDNKLHFAIIGRISNDSYGNELMEKIEKLENITYYGEQDNHFVNKIISSAYILVNTSVSEGFSNTFIQAWQRGTPVISLNSDPDDLIKRENLGYCCDGDFELIQQKIVYLVVNSNLYNDMSSRCIKISNELFSIKNIDEIKKILTNEI